MALTTKHIIGLTSITFRNRPAGDILQLCQDLGIDGIEWGGDVHVPPGNLALAQDIQRKTEVAGITVTAYGSYYRLQNGQDFQPVLASTLALKAPLIRLWAGAVSSGDAPPEYYHNAAQELAAICDAAAAHSISIGLEYHRNTLTDTWESTEKLLSLVRKDNLYTYWQMNPELTFAQRLEEIIHLRSRICCVHTFFWDRDNGRLPLAEGIQEYKDYIALMSDNVCPFIIEFVKDDSEKQLCEDFRTLQKTVK